MKVKNERVRQGAVGHVRLVEHLGRPVVEKRMTDPARHDTEVLALGALGCTELPVPELIQVDRGSILMTLMPGQRLDSLTLDARLTGLEASATLLHRLHDLQPPPGLPPGPDDESIVRRYSDAPGPPLPLRVPRTERLTFCHGDWTDANLLAIDGKITAIVDWERAHLGDPIRELSRAAWAASRKDPRSFDRLVERYGADPVKVREWLPIHAAELWLWFAEAGPPAYLEQLTAELESWPPI
ncbi:phosphotransferase family protein [Microbacterium ureisolvens]|uniref:Aminoglycoside phosphotransferase family protein n=1 Tax=Microbacterium ureisolvens TaxID=2781186 RepID=A0ABS7HZH7_9MICO|nr:aminoglycoside phosphotransferase family protein [Microbacterium ureisolvens]MBW9110000.1 aminoglycoside phosphotransferase family protein [Microbacterium ureisolvens]